MEQIRNSDVPSRQLMSFLEETRIDNDVAKGDYTPARIDTPDIPRSEDIPVRTASTEEEDTSKALEVKSGVAESGDERGWYEVKFGEPFQGELNRPIINATASQRTGEFSVAQYEPPSLTVDGVSLVDVADIQLSQIGVGGVDPQEISVGDIAAGQISIDGVQIGDIKVSVRSIKERSLEHAADISQNGIQIDVPSLNQDVNFAEDLNIDVNLDFSGVDLSGSYEDIVDTSDINNLFSQIEEFDPVQDTKTIEERLKESNRETGRSTYNFIDERLENPSQDIPVIDRTIEVPIRGPILGTADYTLKRVYGGGDGNYSGEGVYESAWGYVGSVLDNTFNYVVERLIGDELDMVESTHDNVSQLRSDIVSRGGLTDTLEDIIESEIGGALEDQLADTRNLRDETGRTLNNVPSEVERVIQQVVSNIDSEIVGSIEQIQSEINAYAQQDVQSSLSEVDGAISNTEAEINALSAEVSQQLVALSEDVDVSFSEMTQQLNEQINLMNEDVQVAVNDQLINTEEQINAVLRDQESQINDVLAITQEDVNTSIQQLASDINDSLSGAEVQVNESLIEIRDQVNASVDEINQNNAQLESRVNSALSEITAQAEASVNESLKVLYDTMGMPEGELMVPVQVRNADNEGFEFLGYEGGTKIDWVATGRSGAGNIVGSPSPGGGDEGDGSGGSDENIGPIVDAVIDRLEDRENLPDSLKGVRTKE